MRKSQRLFSVVGDSISTFAGFSPAGSAYYTPDFASVTGVASVEDTWWMQVIEGLEGVCLSNFSVSGNTVTPGRMGGFPTGRLAALAAEGRQPEVLLLYAGLNDFIAYVPPEIFEAHYLDLLRRLHRLYPQAVLCCGTPILGEIPGTANSLAGLRRRLVPYVEAIRRAAGQEAGCRLVDLAGTGARYEALDAFHPSGRGMKQLAALWLEALKEGL